MSVYTEIFASTKDCPHVVNPDTGPHRCVGSECMAWRWDRIDVIGHCGLSGPVDEKIVLLKVKQRGALG